MGDAVFGSRVSDMAGKPPNLTTHELFVHEKKTVLLQLIFEPLRDLPGKLHCCKTVFLLRNGRIARLRDWQPWLGGTCQGVRLTLGNLTNRLDRLGEQTGPDGKNGLDRTEIGRANWTQRPGANLKNPTLVSPSSLSSFFFLHHKSPPLAARFLEVGPRVRPSGGLLWTRWMLMPN